MSTAPMLDVREVGDVTVVRFLEERIVDASNIQAMGDQLLALVQEDGRRKLVVNFAAVEHFSSAALNYLIKLNHAMLDVEGAIKLCELNPSIQDVFAMTRLDTVFDLRETQAHAIAAF